MSILSALSENRHEKKNLADLAKLPQALIMQMGQRKELTQEEVAMVISKKAEAIESAARQKALEQGGGQMPSVIEQNMMKIAQAENPAPPQQMQQQMMPQQMMSQQMAQGPEDVGIAQNPVPPMQMAGGGIIAFDEGGDIDVDPADDYQDLVDQANEDATNNEIFGIIAAMEGSRTDNAGVGIRSGENKNIKEDTRERGGDMVDRLRAQIMQKESGGKRYDKNGNLLTSSKGALGEMQVMPATARDPGFGIKPAQSDDPNELRRVGDEYANVLLNRYRDPKLAMIAYNMGPGATDKWLASGADIRKLPKETQGYIRGVNLAGGGEVERYQTGGYRPLSAEAANFLQQQKDRTTPAKSTQSAIANKLLRPSMIGSDANVYPGMSDLNYYNELAAELEKDPTYEPYKEEMEKLLKRSPSLLTARQPATNIIGPLANVKRKGEETTKKATPSYMPPVMLEGADNDDASRVMAMPNTAPAPAATPTQEKAEEETFNLMKYIQGRQAKIDKAAEGDKNMALLAAGLGILGGTSPYAFENIGKGAQMGVQQLSQLQKLRASQDIAGDKLLGSAYSAEMLNKIRRDQLTQGKEQRSDKLAQDLQIAKATEIGKRLKLKGITDEMIGMLEQKQMLQTIKPEELAKLNLFKQQMKKVEDDVGRLFPSQGLGSGYSARRIGQ